MLHSWWCFIMQPQDDSRSHTQPRSPAEQKHLLSCSLGLSSSGGENGVWRGQGSLPGPQLQTPHLPGQKQSWDQTLTIHTEAASSARKGQGLTCTHRTSQDSENPGGLTAVCKALGMLNPSSEYSKGLKVSKHLIPTSCSFLWHSWMLNPWPRLMPVSRSSLNKHLCNHSL